MAVGRTRVRRLRHRMARETVCEDGLVTCRDSSFFCPSPPPRPTPTLFCQSGIFPRSIAQHLPGCAPPRRLIDFTTPSLVEQILWDVVVN